MQPQGSELADLFAECDSALVSAKDVFAHSKLQLRGGIAHQADGDEALLGDTPIMGTEDAQLGRGRDCNDAQRQLWSAALQKFIARQDSECPICMGALKRGHGGGCTLLSCSHCFHVKCIKAFEGYKRPIDKGSGYKCPVCRASYKRWPLQT